MVACEYWHGLSLNTYLSFVGLWKAL